MPEHMNIALMLERPTSPSDRLIIISILATVYAPFFGEIEEVCQIDYVTGASQCEAWSDTPRLLGAEPGKHELHFVYGDRATLPDGARSSIHIESNDVRTSFVISLPVPQKQSLARLEPYLLASAQSIGRIANTFVVAAGWEAEVDIDRSPDDVLRGDFTDFDLCLWLGIPKPLLSARPKGFAVLSESEGVVLLRRI